MWMEGFAVELNPSDLFAGLQQIASNRHSTRSFSATPIAPKDLADILAIGHSAPYVSGRKNWDIVVVDNHDIIQNMAEIVRSISHNFVPQIREDFREPFLRYAENFVAFASAPVVLVPVYRVSPSLSAMLPSPLPAITEYERDNHIKSISCVAMMLLLAAEAKGLGACYMTGPLLAEDALCKLLNIRNERRIGALIPIGYPLSKKES